MTTTPASGHPASARHDTAAGRAGEALQTYPWAPEGGRRGPSETLQRVIADLMHWCDDTQRDFDRALTSARALHERERTGA